MAGWTVTHTGDAPVDFLIGMRWTQLWRLLAHPWVPRAFLAMLRADRATGLLRTRLAVRRRGPVVVQRWRDRRAVDAWARAGAQAHAGPWARFARAQPGGTAAWGIWHEVGGARQRRRRSTTNSRTSTIGHTGKPNPNP